MKCRDDLKCVIDYGLSIIQLIKYLGYKIKAILVKYESTFKSSFRVRQKI